MKPGKYGPFVCEEIEGGEKKTTLDNSSVGATVVSGFVTTNKVFPYYKQSTLYGVLCDIAINMKPKSITIEQGASEQCVVIHFIDDKYEFASLSVYASGHIALSMIDDGG